MKRKNKPVWVALKLMQIELRASEWGEENGLTPAACVQNMIMAKTWRQVIEKLKTRQENQEAIQDLAQELLAAVEKSQERGEIEKGMVYLIAKDIIDLAIYAERQPDRWNQFASLIETAEAMAKPATIYYQAKKLFRE